LSCQSSVKALAKATKKTLRVSLAKPGFYLSFFVSPTASWNSLENDEPHRGGNGGTHIEDHDAIKKGEHTNLSYTTGVKLGYTLSKNLSVQTGLNYTLSSTSIDPKLIFADRDNNGNVQYRLDCSSGYSLLLPRNGQSPNRGDSLIVNDSKNSLAYAGIPLAVEYKIIAGKVSVSVVAGGQANILLKGKTTTTFGKGTTNETVASGTTQALKSTYFSAITGITGEFKLNKKLSLTVTPAGQFGLSSINKGASVKTHTNYFSVGAGLKLKL
jgi:Flp pilus assembly pilin Flp